MIPGILKQDAAEHRHRIINPANKRIEEHPGIFEAHQSPNT